MKKVIVLIICAILVLTLAVPVFADSPTTTRSLSGDNQSITVLIEASNFGTFGQIRETIPSGYEFRQFKPISGIEGMIAKVNGNQVIFTFLCTRYGTTIKFEYAVHSAHAGTPVFNGILVDQYRNIYPVMGDAVLP